MAVKWADGAYFDRSSRCLSDGRRWRGDQGARETLSPTLLFEEARSKFWKLSPLEEGGFLLSHHFQTFSFWPEPEDTSCSSSSEAYPSLE